MPTKIDRVNDAYSQMRISGLTVTPSGSDVGVALDRLETMMSELEENRNLCLNYNFEEVPDANTFTGVRKSHRHMMATNLAVRLIPDFNKQVPQILIAQASQALTGSFGKSFADNMREIEPPRRMSIGSGNRRNGNWYRRYNNPEPLPPNDCATNQIAIDDINDYQESFLAYLEGETIASFVITADNGLTIISSSNDDPFISYRISAQENTTNGVWQQVKIVITTSSGRIETRFISFEITTNLTVNSN